MPTSATSTSSPPGWKPSRITRIAHRRTFDEIFNDKNVAAVNPTFTRSRPLVSIRMIYPAEEEALSASVATYGGPDSAESPR